MQYYRFLDIPIRVAQNIVKSRKSYEEDWKRRAVPSYDLIGRTKASYLKYMQDNVVLLEVLCDIEPESPRLEDWKQAKQIIQNDFVENSKELIR